MIAYTHDQAKPGMAHFAGTGPNNKTCKDCKHRGYEREAAGGRVYRYYGCGKYREIMGKIGAEVDSNYAACRYFEQRDKPPPKPAKPAAEDA